MAAKKKTAKKKAPAAKKKTVARAAPKKTSKKKASVTRKKIVTGRSTKKKVTKKKAAAKKRVVTGSSAKKTAKKKATKKKAPTVRKKTVTKRSTKKTADKKTSKKITRKTAPAAGQRAQKFTPYQESIAEDYMNPPQREHFRGLLLDWKKTLMEEVDRTLHHMQDEAANFPDPNDRATQEEEFALELRTRDRERKLIKKIDEAILSLDSGDYGYCEVCGIEIGVKRLEARPTATLCIDCKTLAEIKERQQG